LARAIALAIANDGLRASPHGPSGLEGLSVRSDVGRGDFVMRLSKPMTIETATSVRADWPGVAPVQRRLRAWLRSGRTALAACVHYYQAAAMYEALHRLPPAELERRGFSRGNLARDLCGLDAVP
jgi:hypothetical protein